MRPTALVTGAGRGIGHAVARSLAHHAWVAGFDKAYPDPEGPWSAALIGDVRSAGSIATAMLRVAEERGGLDWVVCAAGIIKDAVSWKMSDHDWDEVIAVNLTGAFNTARAAAPLLRKSPRGRLVLISSINGIRGRFGQTNYAASKAGLVGLGRSLALELARDRVTVNVIAPGFINSPMTQSLPEHVLAKAVARTPLGRLGGVDDVAEAARFLCSDAAGFITGTVLPVDGGQLLGEVA